MTMFRYNACFRLLSLRLHQRTRLSQYNSSPNLLPIFSDRAYTEDHEISPESGGNVLSVPGFIA